MYSEKIALDCPQQSYVVKHKHVMKMWHGFHMFASEGCPPHESLNGTVVVFWMKVKCKVLFSLWLYVLFDKVLVCLTSYIRATKPRLKSRTLQQHNYFVLFVNSVLLQGNRIMRFIYLLIFHNHENVIDKSSVQLRFQFWKLLEEPIIQVTHVKLCKY